MPLWWQLDLFDGEVQYPVACEVYSYWTLDALTDTYCYRHLWPWAVKGFSKLRKIHENKVKWSDKNGRSYLWNSERIYSMLGLERNLLQKALFPSLRCIWPNRTVSDRSCPSKQNEVSLRKFRPGESLLLSHIYKTQLSSQCGLYRILNCPGVSRKSERLEISILWSPVKIWNKSLDRGTLFGNRSLFKGIESAWVLSFVEINLLEFFIL